MIFGYGQLGELDPSQLGTGNMQGMGDYPGLFQSTPLEGFLGMVPRYDQSGMASVPGMIPMASMAPQESPIQQMFGSPSSMSGTKGGTYSVKPPKIKSALTDMGNEQDLGSKNYERALRKSYNVNGMGSKKGAR